MGTTFCEHCGEEIEDENGLVCPHCRVVLDEYRYMKQKRNKAVMIGVAVLAFAVLAGFIGQWVMGSTTVPPTHQGIESDFSYKESMRQMARSAERDEHAAAKQKAHELQVGNPVYLGFKKKKAAPAVVYASRDIMKAAANDADGYLITQLIESKHIIQAPVNTEAIISKIDGDDIEIMLTDGPGVGRVVWTRRKEVNRTRL